jgi:hypothetical protein
MSIIGNDWLNGRGALSATAVTWAAGAVSSLLGTAGSFRPIGQFSKKTDL